MINIFISLIWFLSAMICSFFAIKLAWKIDFLSHPNEIVKSHKKPVAYLGGIGLYVAFLISYLTSTTFLNQEEIDTNTRLLLLVLALYTIYGALDDYYRFSPTIKFIGQFILGLAIIYLGFYISLTPFVLLNQALSLFGLLFLVNAFNLIDVCDGLLSLTFIPSLIFFFIFGIYPLMALILIFSLLGFLFFNKPDASIYLGDAGCHFLGAIAYVMATQFIDPTYFIKDGLILLMVFGVICFEFFFLAYRRTKQGLSIFKGSPDHFSILLTNANWSKNKIVVSAFIASIILCTAACFISYSSSLLVIGMSVVFFVLALIVGKQLDKN